jgi:Fe2+ or Zn2+ uptake regulation protein
VYSLYFSCLIGDDELYKLVQKLIIEFGSNKVLRKTRMANHCIEVCCPECGRAWCTRGCGFNSPPDKELAKEYKKRLEEKRVIYAGVKCDKCGASCVMM